MTRIQKCKRVWMVPTVKLTNIAGFRNIDEYVQNKIARYAAKEKNFETLFSFMFSERDNVMAELSDGFRIKKITYGECADKIEAISGKVEEMLSIAPKGSIIGLYMSNSIQWIQTFWAILMSGYRPLLINSRMNTETLEKTLEAYQVAAVLSDGKNFQKPTFPVSDIFQTESKGKASAKAWGEEVLFMSSGTSNNVKLCAYTGENFFYQICDSVDIIRRCPQMKKHYEGELKILALLPFYHVFGFIAVYLWFGFFSRTLVFLKELHAQTLLNTIKKHKVTHIFAVPLIWETIYKTALQKIRARDEKTYRKFQKALTFVSKTECVGSLLANAAFKEIRDNLFGESICFLITGGSGISKDALSFFNGIGYHMANGYGMTEIGITSVEISMKRKMRNQGSVGAPFGCTEYSLSDSGELLVRGKTMATRVMQNGEDKQTDFGAWFNTRDLAVCKDGKYYLQGREDDLIVCKNGEKINPELLESSLKVSGVEDLCLFTDGQGKPTLLLSVTNCFSAEKLRFVHAEALKALEKAQLKDEVQNVALTMDKLLEGNDFKVSRKKIATRYKEGKFNLINYQQAEAYTQQLLSALEKELCACFAQVLQTDVKEIHTNADFFTDLGGSSLDYFALIDTIKNQLNVELAISEDERLSTVEQFYQAIKNL